ncbi:uncharacterized protein [Argopecten irradians]|uniref:uncharacterized protein isoform X2 n=1 Tax=Argopecten irradians TaxID=31199 RepID=UPI003722497D
MVKRTSGPTRNMPRRSSARSIGLELMMDCHTEELSTAQIQHIKKCRLEFDNAMAMIKAAQAKARAGKATVSIQKVHSKNIPPPNPVSVPVNQQNQPERSASPDVIFVGESPPPPTQKTTVTSKPAAPPPRPITKSQTITPAVQTASPLMANIQGSQQYIIRGSTVGNTVQGPLRLVPLSSVNQYQQQPPVPVQFQVPKQNPTPPAPNPRTSQSVSAASMLVNSAIMAKRHLESTQDSAGPAKKKLKKPGDVLDNIGSWVPLDEYYYGKMEGDPSYLEDKAEYRFKCWYCSKMLYNNVKAMMHIQGHIDSGKQHNLDLSDLTQCKHCYKQFDTPFEMQTHVEKVHMNGANVLLCRICERDHESRNALTHHMRQNHNACEMPYICHLCNFRSSMYSDVVDHFKKKHDSSPHILCLYCLKVFKVKFVSMGWGQTQTYYGHLLKHQSKASTKKCTLCRLTFYNVADVKAHKKKDHQANHKGVLGANNRYSTPGQVMIKVPESGLQPKPQSVKSLNAPAVSKVLDFGGTRFPTIVNYLTCLECKMSMGTPDHFKKYIECSMCRFATSCSIAYANHMMGFHSCQVSSLNLNIPWEHRMESPMYCLCGFGSRYGNKIANHLVYCTKRTCYVAKPDIPMSEEGADDMDPRRKPGASILDVLGLVKKRTVTTKEEMAPEVIRRSSHDDPPVLTNMNTLDPVDSTKKTDIDEIPPELTGMQKWTTVKIKDSATPSKASVFLGADDKMIDEDDIDVSLSEELQTTIQNIVDENTNKPDTDTTDDTKEKSSNFTHEKSEEDSSCSTNICDRSEKEPDLEQSENPTALDVHSLSEGMMGESGKSTDQQEDNKCKDDMDFGKSVLEFKETSDTVQSKNTPEQQNDNDVDNLDDDAIDELLKDDDEKISSKEEKETVMDSEEKENELLGDSESQTLGNGQASQNKGDNSDIEGKDLKDISSLEEEKVSMVGDLTQSKECAGDQSKSAKADEDIPDCCQNDIERGCDTSEETKSSDILSEDIQTPENSIENKDNASTTQIEVETCEAENRDLSEEKEEGNSTKESEDNTSTKESEDNTSTKESEDNTSTKESEDNTSTKDNTPQSEGDNSQGKADDSQDKGGYSADDRKTGSRGDSSGKGDNARQDDRRSYDDGDQHRQHSRDRDRYDDKERSRSRDSRHDDRTSKSDYRDNRSQGSYRSHGDHHGDRSHDWDRNHSRSNRDERNWRHSDNRSYHGNQDHHSYRDNRSYHGNSQYNRDDRRQGNYHDNYQSNRNHSNYRGGRGGYGNHGGYQGNYR